MLSDQSPATTSKDLLQAITNHYCKWLLFHYKFCIPRGRLLLESEWNGLHMDMSQRIWSVETQMHVLWHVCRHSNGNCFQENVNSHSIYCVTATCNRFYQLINLSEYTCLPLCWNCATKQMMLQACLLILCLSVLDLRIWALVLKNSH
jgi:hypothetical protein